MKKILFILFFAILIYSSIEVSAVSCTYMNASNVINCTGSGTKQTIWDDMNLVLDTGNVFSCKIVMGGTGPEVSDICYIRANLYFGSTTGNFTLQDIIYQFNLTSDGQFGLDQQHSWLSMKNVTWQSSSTANQLNIEFWNTTYTNIDNTTFNDCGYNNAATDGQGGVAFTETTGLVNNSVFKLGKKGIILNGYTRVNVLNSQFIGNPRRGIVLNEYLIAGFPVGHPTNTLIDRNNISGTLQGIEIIASDNNTIMRNTLTDIGTTGINVYGAYGLGNDERIIRNTTIENNTIQSYGTSAFAIAMGINVLGMLVKSNYIEGIRGETIAGRNNIGINLVDANDSLILSNYIYMTGGVADVANVGIYLQNSKNDTIEKNYVKATANNSVSDIGIGIYIVSSSNITRYNNSYINTAQTSSGTSYAIFDNGDSGHSTDEFVSGGDAYGLYNPGGNNTYTNLTITGTTDGVLLAGAGNTFINSSFPSNGGADGAVASHNDNNTIFINTYFGTHTAGGYSYYSYTSGRGENKCYNCSFAEAIYIEDNNAFRLLEFWQGYTNTTGDSPVSGATMSCRNDSSPYTTLWTENTNAQGYTGIYNRTYKYYAYATESSPDETWGDIVCNSTKAGASTDTLGVLWTHSWLNKEFWLNLTFPVTVTLDFPIDNKNISQTWEVFSCNWTINQPDNLSLIINNTVIYSNLAGVNLSYNHTVTNGTYVWGCEATKNTNQYWHTGNNRTLIVWNYTIIPLPSTTTPIIWSIPFFNLTTNNLTVNFTTSNSETNITDWRKNNISLGYTYSFDLNNDSTWLGWVKDYSSYENNMNETLSSHLPNWTSSNCIKGGCYEFRKGSYYLNTTNYNIEEYNKYTISFWVKFDSPIPFATDPFCPGNWVICKPVEVLGDCGPMCDYGTCDLHFKEENQEIEIRHGDSYVTLPGTINYNEWYNFALNYDNSTKILKSYINGINILNSTVSELDYLSTGNSMIFGYRIEHPPPGETGGPCGRSNITLDEVKLFINTSLSSKQIKAIYEEELANRSWTTLTDDTTLCNDSWSVGVTPTNFVTIGQTLYSESLKIQCQDIIITLDKPADNLNTIVSTQTFSCNWTVDQPENMSLSIDNNIINTITTGLNLSYTYNLPIGTHVWGCNAYRENILYWSTTNRTIIISPKPHKPGEADFNFPIWIDDEEDLNKEWWLEWMT